MIWRTHLKFKIQHKKSQRLTANSQKLIKKIINVEFDSFYIQNTT